MKVMENLEKTQCNLVISLMTLGIKRKEREKSTKKKKSHIKQVLIYGLLYGYPYQAFIFEKFAATT